MMASKSTIAWRTAVLALLFTAVPAGLYWYDQQQRVDTETMLDVSVSIKTLSYVRVDSVGDSVWEPAIGSGFLVSVKDCEVLTNHHVVADAAYIEVYPRQWAGASGIPATVINSNPRSDIALLRMSHCDGITQATLGDSDRMQPGDEVYAVGNPLGRNPDSISRGIVSHTERFTTGLLPYLQTDATISRGNSGGALFNRQGEVIGVNTAILATPDGNNLGIGYALPINLVKTETTRLHSGPPSWGDAGLDDIVAGLTPEEASVFHVPGGRAAIIVTQTPETGPGVDKLLAKDVVYKIGEAEVTNVDQAKRIIGSHGPGDTVAFHIVRAGEHMIVDLILAEGWKPEELRVPDYYEGYLGMSLEMWEEEEGTRGRFETPVITMVQSLGPAHMAHVASSQKTIARNGPLVIPVQLDVKTVTGVVYDGTYYGVSSVDELEQHAVQAFEASSPMLLEIETWARSNPLKFSEPLERRKTTFHRVMPALSAASAPTPAEESDVVAEDKPQEPTTTEVAYFDARGNR